MSRYRMPNPTQAEPLWIRLHDLNIAVRRTYLDRSLPSAMDQHVNLRGFREYWSRDCGIVKIVADFSVGRFCNKVKSSIAGKGRPGVSLRDISLHRKHSRPPPLIGK